MNELEERTLEANNSVKIAEFLLGQGIPFRQQVGRNGYFDIIDDSNGRHTMVAVNLDRNRWYSEGLKTGGNVTDLVEVVMHRGKVDLPMLEFMEGQASKARELEVRSTFDFRKTKVAVKVKFGPLEDPVLLSHLCAFGISTDISTRYLVRGTYLGMRDGKEHHAAAFANDGGGYYLFNGSDFRTFGTDGISTIGERRKGQRLCVYENAMDFLAMMQKRYTLGTDALLGNDRHLVINGGKNLGDALDHIKGKSDYEDICCIFPRNEQGKEMFAKISDISNGTAIDSSRLYTGFLTIGETLPGRLGKTPRSQERKEESDLREEDMLPMLHTGRAISGREPGEGKSRKGRTVDVVIPRQDVGMKL